MNITFTTNSNFSFSIPIQLLFWGFVAVYVIHILGVFEFMVSVGGNLMVRIMKVTWGIK